MYCEINEDENTIYQILCDATKEVLIGKFITINKYVKKL